MFWLLAIVALVLLLGIPAHAAGNLAAADGWVVDQWTTEDGLPTDHAMDVARTPDGTIWVASTSGLLRFDGVTFQAVPADELPGLTTSRHIGLAVHPEDGALWILSDHGLAVSRLHEGELQIWDRASGLPAGSCIEEGAREVWLGTMEGLYTLSDHPERIQPTLFPAGISDVQAMPSGEIWVSWHDGVARRSPDGTFTSFGEGVGVPNFIGRLGATRDDRPFLIQSLSGPIWSWDGDGFSQMPGDVRATGWTVLTEQPTPVRGSSPVWSVSLHGVHHNDQLVLPFDGRISSTRAMPDGSLWLTTMSAGVLRVRPSAVQVVRSGEVDAQVSAVMVDGKGRLWLKGLRDWWTPGPGGPDLLEIEGDGPGGMLYQHGAELRFAGTGVLSVVDVEGGRRVEQRSDHRFDFAQASEVDASGRAWLAGRGGLLREDPDGGEWIQWTDADGQRIKEVRDLLPHPNGGLLVAAGGRGLLWVQGPGRSERLDQHSGAVTDSPRHVRLDGDRIWLSTEDAGLCTALLHTAADSPWRCLGQDRGLPARGAHTSVADELGRVWISTNRGIAVARGEQLDAFARGSVDRVDFLVLDERDGMPNAECNGGNDQAYARDFEGRLWFATQKGAVGVQPASFHLPDAPAVDIERVVVGDTLVDLADVVVEASAPPMRLSWSVADAPWSDRARFQVRVGEEPWSSPQSARQTSLARLPSGRTRVEVRAVLAGAVGPSAVLSVFRRPQLHEHPLFPLLLVVLGGLATGGLALVRARGHRVRERELENQVAARTEALTLTARKLEAQKDQLAEQAARLSQLDDLRTRMIVNLHHELRTPVALVLGPLDALLEQRSLDGEGRRHAELARRSADELEKLVGQLFDLTRLEAGELPIRSRRIDLGALARRVVARHAFAAEQRGIALVAPEGSLSLWCDPELIDKAINNLVGNALKYSPSGGCVRVALEPEGDRALLRVLDDGPGVPTADRKRIFERLFQVDRSDRRAHGGAGLGLALSREVVELHGGRIGVDGRDTGGAAFWVRLPLDDTPHSIAEVDLEETSDELAPAEWADPPTGEDLPIALVVEDHPDMRAFLASQLAPAFRVVTAPDGAAGLVRARALPPHVVVSDMMMPEMTGLELARALRADERLAAVPILLVSAKSSQEDRVEGLEVADDYLVKPFGVAELRARVSRLVVRAGAAGTVDAVATGPVLQDADSALLARLEALVDDNLADDRFGVTDLARLAGMSTRTLRRELHRLAGEPPSDWLRGRRLLRAHALLEARAFRTVGEVAAAVGLSRSYFGRAYRAAYGCSPSEVLAREDPEPKSV
jgi:signal transduction histidine kinase/CheY-like chemotaxis protein/ligand-binding sensor domain-containing protein/AraC-like DNA-binding protein